MTAYGVTAAFQPSHELGRVLAAYGGVFIVGSLLWGIACDGLRPDRADILGAAICLSAWRSSCTAADDSPTNGQPGATPPEPALDESDARIPATR